MLNDRLSFLFIDQPSCFCDKFLRVSFELVKYNWLDASTEVAVYVKLPKSFYISTPVGHYTPDWAIAFHESSVKYIYFVAETKGAKADMQLRMIEDAKVHCAREHFKAISNGSVVYDVVDSYTTLMEKEYSRTVS